jgi:hypothetical protein
MLQFKIHGSTPVGGKSLCVTCKFAKIVKGQNCQELTYCEAIFENRPVPFRIAECSRYHPSNMPWLHEMEQMAWKIEARRKGPAGFSDPQGEMEVIITAPKRDPD